MIHHIKKKIVLCRKFFKKILNSEGIILIHRHKKTTQKYL